MKIKIDEFDTRIVQVRTRMPFKYGIATMTEVPHLFLILSVTIDGKRTSGVAADFLPPKWFRKDPAQPLSDEIVEMKEVIAHAAALARGLQGQCVFDLWQEIAAGQKTWALKKNLPPLLANFGVSLLERALIEATCKKAGLAFPAALDHPALGIRLEEIHPELGPAPPSRWFSRPPLTEITIRHTVGLGDPLDADEIPAAEKIDDGLPQSLRECIRRYRLKHFKIKISGRTSWDLERVRRALEIIGAETNGQFAFSLDGNEQFECVESFREFCQALARQRWYSDCARRLLFLEQPLHRAVALSPDVRQAMHQWSGRPHIIIDESDSEPSSLPAALELGYAGVSHKNCKGIFKGLANRALLVRRSALDPRNPLWMTGEDLCTIGPVSLLQDLVMMALLGIRSVERNGHHYCRGLSMFSSDAQKKALQHHPDLFESSSAGWPTLRIQNGTVSIRSLVKQPFGVGFSMADAI